MKAQSSPSTVVLMILDGFGYSEKTDNNAVAAANTPNWDRLWSASPHGLLDCSGSSVGLPDLQMGNSEVGHLHLGAGRLLAQDFTRINNAVKNGSFFDNPVLCQAADQAAAADAALHVLGMLSPGGVHSHEKHIQAMLELAAQRGVKRVYLHAFLDGRDMPPQSAEPSLKLIDETFARLGVGRTASIIGRFYAMDRDNRWDRVQQAYDLIVDGRAQHRVASAVEGLQTAYARGESDEFVESTAIVPPGMEPVTVNDGDVVVFMNFRADRTRELTRAFTNAGFDGFDRSRVPQLGSFVCLTQYHKGFGLPMAYGPQSVKNSFGDVLSHLGLRQLRAAETEKYAHVTFFFNGGVEQPVAGEDRVLVPSPKVKTYDLQPEMNAPELTDRLVDAIESGQYQAIITNYANCDMVGHTGNFAATVKAVEAVDQAIGRIVEALRKVGGELFITADHGNAEQMADPSTQQAHTAHTTNPVPFLYVGREGRLAPSGDLSDVAPTLLYAMGIPVPPEMTGRSLLQFAAPAAASQSS